MPFSQDDITAIQTQAGLVVDGKKSEILGAAETTAKGEANKVFDQRIAKWFGAAVVFLFANCAIIGAGYLKVVHDISSQKGKLLTELKQLPLGTILPVGLPPDQNGNPVPYKAALDSLYLNLPRNWIICDGSSINGGLRGLKKDEVDDCFWNTKAPDLTSHFMRGTGVGEFVGGVGGVDASQALTVTTSPGGTHTHLLPATTGSCDDSVSSDPGNHSYFVRDHGKGFTQEFKLATQPAQNDDGQHRHKLGGEVSGGEHTHTFTISRKEITPAYVNVIYIIRIK